jgi:hypothetical protein
MKTKMPDQTLKTLWARAGLLSLAAVGLALVSGCVVRPDGRVGLEFPVVTVAPVVVAGPSVVVEPALVPEAYTWDGVEYVGLVGDRYYYLGPGDVWLVAGPDRLAFFHGWERGHPDWRSHATRNDRYRRDAQGHSQPRRDEKRA